jgi:hypothetical protein
MSGITPRNDPPEPPRPPREPFPWKRALLHVARMLLILMGVLVLLAVILVGIIIGICTYGGRR